LRFYRFLIRLLWSAFWEPTAQSDHVIITLFNLCYEIKFR